MKDLLVNLSPSQFRAFMSLKDSNDCGHCVDINLILFSIYEQESEDGHELAKGSHSIHAFTWWLSNKEQ